MEVHFFKDCLILLRQFPFENLKNAEVCRRTASLRILENDVGDDISRVAAAVEHVLQQLK